MLDALGHNAQTFRQRIMESLEGKYYEAARRDLDHMIRLDRGQGALCRLLDDLQAPGRVRRRADAEASQEPATFERLLNDQGGRSVVIFIVDKLSLGERDWVSRRLLQELGHTSPELAERLLKRMVEAAANDAAKLGDYAVSFEEQGDLNAAEALYKRAIDADPKYPRNLWNYGNFLEKHRRDIGGAEAHYKRAIEADPKSASRLGKYALFRRRLGDMNGAEAYFKLAIEANPQDAGHLANYAIFLKNERGDYDGAEAYYKRAIEADPRSAFVLGSYALLLARQRGDKEGAEGYYKRSFEADPKHAGNLTNYGQVLAGFGRLAEAEKILIQAFRNLDRSQADDAAEVCFSLWLVLRMRGRQAKRWEQRFKFLIQQGFKRSPWDFDLMLQQAEKVLSAEELDYAKALAAAFLNESKVADLAKYPRWQALEPIDPKASPAAVAS
jgi:tetratricopeptide (TPR) repeat protein